MSRIGYHSPRRMRQCEGEFVDHAPVERAGMRPVDQEGANREHSERRSMRSRSSEHAPMKLWLNSVNLWTRPREAISSRRAFHAKRAAQRRAARASVGRRSAAPSSERSPLQGVPRSLAADRADLDAYVRHVADTPLDTLHGQHEKLAHMINAYNALSMYNVVESGIPVSHAGLAKVRFFVLRKLTVGGVQTSLFDFENHVIRPFARTIGEPRIHFALNCSAVACPVLPRTPFRSATLDAELESEARAFFARPENFRVDAAARSVWLSEILEFYPEDFVPAFGRNLIDFANRYAPQAAPVDWEVRFTPYDWTVANSRRAR